MKCRNCGSQLRNRFLDLGHAPPSNAYRLSDDLKHLEKYYPLKVQVCDACWLVQTEDCAQADELFGSDYAYFSSTSPGWLAHAAKYAEKMIGELGLDHSSLVLEVGSNDGYLLKNFVSKGIPCLGIEPTVSTAQVAENLGIPVLRKFFCEELGQQLSAAGGQADLIAGNNVFAHVPDINDFTRGLKVALKAGGTITLEFPHLMRLMENYQFDTIYHEHFSYLSVFTVSQILERARLRIFRIDELLTHGGSLRIFVCHAHDPRGTESSVDKLLKDERDHGLQELTKYLAFQAHAERIKDDFISFLIKQKKNGKLVAAYGAAAKGNTLLNYSGVKSDLISFVVDACPAKQGKYLPGSHIPILDLDEVRRRKPDYLIVLPWNLIDEVEGQMSDVKEWGCAFVTAIPELDIR